MPGKSVHGIRRQRRAVERLLDAGADLAFHPDYASETPAQIAAGLDTRRANLVEWLNERADTLAAT